LNNNHLLLIKLKNFWQIYRSKVIDNLNDFKKISDAIEANRMVGELSNFKAKVYTRDLFNSD